MTGKMRTDPEKLRRLRWNPLPVAVTMSAMMVALVLMSSERQTSVRREPPLPSELQIMLAKTKLSGASAPGQQAQSAAIHTDADLTAEEAQADALGVASSPISGQALAPAERAAVGPPAGAQNLAVLRGNSTLAPSADGATPTASEPLDLPVAAPNARGSSTLGTAPYAATSKPSLDQRQRDPLEEIRRAMAPTNPGTLGNRGLPIPTPPPIAMPRELAQATPAPTRTASVLQRVRNIPTHLIQTPYPILTNSSSTDEPSPAADPTLATDVGKTPLWSDPNHPLLKGLREDTVAIPTVPSGTLQVSSAESLAITPSVSRVPRIEASSVPSGARNTPSRERVSPVVTPQVFSASPPQEGNPSLTPGATAPEATLRPTQAPTAAVDSSEPTASPRGAAPRELEHSLGHESRISPSERTWATPPPTFEKEIRTTGEFTVRKGRAIVTFSNVPVESVQTRLSATSSTVAGEEETPTVSASKVTALPKEAQPEATTVVPADIPKFEPKDESEPLVEQRLQELARTGSDTKLAQRLASKAIPASVGDRILTREELERHVRAFETLRGYKLNEDQRVNIEGVLAQDWLERTAVAAIAREHGLTVSDEEVSAEIERRKARFGQNLPNALRQAGFSEQEVREEMRNALLVDKLVEKTMAETYPESKLRELYEAHPERYTPSRRLHVREIFKQKQPGREQEARAAIERIRLEIAKGATFEELAQRESESPTREQNGDLGWIDASKPLSPRQAQALADLKPGQVSDVIELGDGFQLLKVVEIEEPKPGFEGAREAVKTAVRDHIIGMAYDEAMARYEVKLRNKRLTPRLPHPEVSKATSPAGGGAKTQSETQNPRSQRAKRPATQAPTATPALLSQPKQLEPPPANQTPGAKRRLIPFLKKRSEQ
ncbi:MAG: peptidylprolyl isomerase [Candidatus Sumerlaeaceae bacterium]